VSADETTNVTDDAASTAESDNNGADGVQPSSPTDDMEAILKQLNEAQQQAGEYLEGWQRARAEFANYKKRVERELQDNREQALGMALKSVLPVVDDFDRALASVPEDIQDNPWVSGVSMVQRKLYRLLEEHGVTAFDPVGEMFDPTRHEAIGSDGVSDAPSGQITATLQKGYLIGEHVLRPALVRVAQ
jgi:molecular chaperone GrpE